MPLQAFRPLVAGDSGLLRRNPAGMYHTAWRTIARYGLWGAAIWWQETENRLGKSWRAEDVHMPRNTRTIRSEIARL